MRITSSLYVLLLLCPLGCIAASAQLEDTPLPIDGIHIIEVYDEYWLSFDQAYRQQQLKLHTLAKKKNKANKHFLIEIKEVSNESKEPVYNMCLQHKKNSLLTWTGTALTIEAKRQDKKQQFKIVVLTPKVHMFYGYGCVQVFSLYEGVNVFAAIFQRRVAKMLEVNKAWVRQSGVRYWPPEIYGMIKPYLVHDTEQKGLVFLYRIQPSFLNKVSMLLKWRKQARKLIVFYSLKNGLSQQNLLGVGFQQQEIDQALEDPPEAIMQQDTNPNFATALHRLFVPES